MSSALRVGSAYGATGRFAMANGLSRVAPCGCVPASGTGRFNFVERVRTAGFTSRLRPGQNIGAAMRRKISIER